MTTDTILPFHPLADLFPLLEGADFADLVADIRDHGQRLPIIVHQGQILDGRNRYRAALEADVDPILETLPDDADPRQIVRSLNLTRRHLTTDQRAAIAAELVPAFAEAARQRQLAGKPVAEDQKGTAAEQAGRELAVSEATVKRALARQRDDPGAHERARRGERTRRPSGGRTHTRPQTTAAEIRGNPPMLRALTAFQKALPPGWGTDGSQGRLEAALARLPTEARADLLREAASLRKPITDLWALGNQERGTNTLSPSQDRPAPADGGLSPMVRDWLLEAPLEEIGALIAEAIPYPRLVQVMDAIAAEVQRRIAAGEIVESAPEPEAPVGRHKRRAPATKISRTAALAVANSIYEREIGRGRKKIGDLTYLPPAVDEPEQEQELEQEAGQADQGADEQDALRQRLGARIDEQHGSWRGRGVLRAVAAKVGTSQATLKGFLEGGSVYGKTRARIEAYLNG